eukprot:455723-Prymnesium_polylepis.1
MTWHESTVTPVDLTAVGPPPASLMASRSAKIGMIIPYTYAGTVLSGDHWKQVICASRLAVTH